MNFTDIFIRRPVLATVVSLLIFVIGIRSVFLLPVLQFPRTENAVVTVSTAYFGANAELVAGFITTPLENAISQANGIDYISSSSAQGGSAIQATLRLNYDSNKALTEIISKVNSVSNQLPKEAQQPVISIAVGETIDSMYIGFNSEVLSRNQMTDYLIRVVQPKIQAVEGVQEVEILGEKRFAIRAWLDPEKLAAYGLTATDVSQALAANDYLSAVGETRGRMVSVDLTASTNNKSLAEFRQLIIRSKNGAFVRLSDVANVTLGSAEYDTAAGFDGKASVQLGIKVAPSANLLDVMKRVREAFPEIQAQLPTGLNGAIAYDATAFVNSSINEVVRTLVEALLIVTFVVFAFLGSPRSVLIPTIAIPLSLVGTFTLMLILGFSINLLTLLALVLSIGLVVDDAIIVVENVNRHLEEGMRPHQASLLAARELAGPIIAMTVVLVAVYLPIGFLGGLTGALFTEFAFTLVGAVTMSAVIALTLSPMMCARVLRASNEIDSEWEKKLVSFIDRRFEEMLHVYQRMLHSSLDHIQVTIVFALIVLGSIYFLYGAAKSELAPPEDQGIIIGLVTAPPNATVDQRLIYQQLIWDIYASHEEMGHVFQFTEASHTISGMVLTPWDEREKSAKTLERELQQQLGQIAGARIAAVQPPPLPGSRGFPVEFVIQTTESFTQLNDVVQAFMDKVQKSGQFVYIDTDLRFDKPQAEIIIDREKVAQFGLTMRDVGSSLSAMLGGGYVNYFSLDGRSYKVIPQVQQADRLNVDQLKDFYIRTSQGVSVPLSTIATIKKHTVPRSLGHFQQLNSATISGVPMPGLTSGQVLEYLQNLAKTDLPAGYSVDYSGASRQYVQESSALVVTFFFAMIIIFLALAAQFESFRDPLIILVSVPMSICGALIAIVFGMMFGASLNIYTQVGLVTLIGLISKHGILIVEFANALQAEGRSKREAIEEATAIRLRPILMTTAAMVLGVIPLILASGAGAASRFNLGLVIASGLSIGTCFTLFVVPAVYLLFAGDHSHKGTVDADDDDAVLV